MFRFIHTADTHIDSPLRGLDAYDGAPVEALRGATRRAFEHLVRLALDEAVDFVVIASDLYDGDWKDFSTGLFFTRQMARLREAGIPVYVIAGNHDAASVRTRRLSLPDNVHFFSTRAAESKRVAGLPVIIHGRGCQLVSVSDSLEVIDAEQRALDLVRWQRIGVDLSAAAGLDQALGLIGEALQAALPTADGRLLAARIGLFGATALHGQPQRNQPRLRAECNAQGQMIAPDALWIEAIEIDTTPPLSARRACRPRRPDPHRARDPRRRARRCA